MSDFYVTPYRDALQWAGQNLPDETFKTFIMLMSHANDLGVCFPGYRRLVELTLHDVQRVGDEMQQLLRLDVVRQVEPATQDRYGRWTPALYQINPKLLRLREKSMDEAMALWNSVLILEQKVPVQTLTSIVSIESEQNQNQNQQNQTESLNSSSSKPEIHPEKEVPNAGQIAAWQFQREAPQREAQSDRASRPTQKTDVPAATPPAAVAPGKYRQVDPVRKQLRFAHEEDLAQLVYQKTLMTRALARGLIVTYGYQSVAAALESEFVRFAEKPAGALRHVLEKQQICDETLNIDDVRNPGPRTEQLSEIEY